jgi:ABC-2 type transport system permease protein
MNGVLVNAQPGASYASAVVEVVRVTMRQLMGRRRTIWLLLLSALPILLAIIFRAADTTDIRSYTSHVYDTIIVTILMPLVAILFATGAFGAEIDDGTAVYLLAKPVPRWMLVCAKAASVIVVSVLLTGAATLVSGLIVLGGTVDGPTAVGAQLFGVVVGSICYSCLFLTVSLFTRRALVIGVGYMLVWEGVLSFMLAGIANLSVRQYALGASSAIYKLPIEEQRLTSDTALILSLALVVITMALAIWKLMRFELPGGND